MRNPAIRSSTAERAVSTMTGMAGRCGRQDLRTVDVGQPEVEQEQVGPDVLDQMDSLGAGRRSEYRQAGSLEVAPQDFADVPLVLHHEHRLHGLIVRPHIDARAIGNPCDLDVVGNH